MYKFLNIQLKYNLDKHKLMLSFKYPLDRATYRVYLRCFFFVDLFKKKNNLPSTHINKIFTVMN